MKRKHLLLLCQFIVVLLLGAITIRLKALEKARIYRSKEAPLSTGIGLASHPYRQAKLSLFSPIGPTVEHKKFFGKQSIHGYAQGRPWAGAPAPSSALGEYEMAYAAPDTCKANRLSGTLSVTKAQMLLVPMAQIEALVASTVMGKFIVYPQGETPEEHLTKHWYAFGGASVWLAEYGVFYHTTRVMFSPTGAKGEPTMSYIYAQLYDADWNEAPGSLETPSGLVQRFPQLLPIPFFMEDGRKYMGPEDSRVLTRRNPAGYEEPMIVFNMMDEMMDKKRLIHAYFPFTEELVAFRIYGYKALEKEKNWTPFFDPDSSDGDTHIRFVYNMNPMEVLRCDLASGWCRFTQGTAVIDDEDDSSGLVSLEDLSVSELRGGSTLLKVPRGVVAHQPEGTEYYVGFARAHLLRCGCASSMYRPNLVVLRMRDAKLSLVLVSSFVDFEVPIAKWYPGDHQSYCSGNNVLLPNGISYWDIKSDLMGLTLSSADETLMVVHIHGVAAFVATALAQTADDSDQNNSPGLSDAVSCALKASRAYCWLYGISNANQIIADPLYPL